MINKMYRISRDDIYVGQVVKGEGLVRNHLDHDYLGIKAGELGVIQPRALRSILFSPSRENFAVDLLYDSPLYPVLNMTNDEVCMAYYKDSILVDRAVNLGEILAYYKFEQNLVFEEVQQIRRAFFGGGFAQLYEKDFDITGKEYGRHTASRADYKYLLSQDDYLAVRDLSDAPLPEVFLNPSLKADAFKPERKVEGKIKTLKKLR